MALFNLNQLRKLEMYNCNLINMINREALDNKLSGRTILRLQGEFQLVHPLQRCAG